MQRTGRSAGDGLLRWIRVGSRRRLRIRGCRARSLGVRTLGVRTPTTRRAFGAARSLLVAPFGSTGALGPVAGFRPRRGPAVVLVETASLQDDADWGEHLAEFTGAIRTNGEWVVGKRLNLLEVLPAGSAGVLVGRHSCSCAPRRVPRRTRRSRGAGAASWHSRCPSANSILGGEPGTGAAPF